jgi:hypothetical protein
MSVARTNPALVSAIVYDRYPPIVRTASGYGGRLPTAYRVRYGNRLRRVYVMQYGNAGSAYIVVGGNPAFLDIATEYALSDGILDDALGMAL